MSYLIHFNQNHSPKTGQFTFGDGDGDGRKDEHHRYSDSSRSSQSSGREVVNGQTLKTIVKGGAWLVGKAFIKTELGKTLNDYNAVLNYGKKTVKWENYIKSDSFYQKAADFINKYSGG